MPILSSYMSLSTSTFEVRNLFEDLVFLSLLSSCHKQYFDHNYEKNMIMANLSIYQGWKLSDMMFVTRRGLTDACSAVGKQLDHISSSISVSFHEKLQFFSFFVKHPYSQEAKWHYLFIVLYFYLNFS